MEAEDSVLVVELVINNVYMENKPINMHKIDEIIAKGSSTFSRNENIRTSFKTRMYNFFHKKNVLIVCFLVIVLGICLFIFKDIIDLT